MKAIRPKGILPQRHLKKNHKNPSDKINTYEKKKIYE
uniref:Uncharacterized protein n=1 Tax=Rhizophora mucronata TaxID=61149 RepID=A0A2P2QVQ4_RHIMU